MALPAAAGDADLPAHRAGVWQLAGPAWGLELHSPYGDPPAPDLDQRVRASGEW
ncbi:hypothetical protein [Acidovorax sp. SUPP3334]|uniref:hypothetical protein n=1 Tax=Acidovorax sp. SUPP3334 TaxID=2920881 RepID=UPI0023DE2034|nr:hypothetical protein [Acidovorax sp. SUPP3334]GKT21250.1 hypothetical protein AVHM3334_04145 [Acidovorax sp. SUPP3334]